MLGHGRRRMTPDQKGPAIRRRAPNWMKSHASQKASQGSAVIGAIAWANAGEYTYAP